MHMCGRTNLAGRPCYQPRNLSRLVRLPWTWTFGLLTLPGSRLWMGILRSEGAHLYDKIYHGKVIQENSLG